MPVVCSVPDEGGYGYDDKEEVSLSSEDKGAGGGWGQEESKEA